MPGGQVGLRLHQETGRTYHLDWSLRMYRWTNSHLQTSDGWFHDHLDLQGKVDETIWSYNEILAVLAWPPRRHELLY